MRRGTGELLLKLLNLLEYNKTPLTISEISEKISANWETTTANLEILSKLGYVQKKEDGKYALIKPFTTSPDTFFRIPLEKKARDITKSVFALIQNVWQKNSKDALNKTRAHKYAVEIVQKFNLEAPILWYKFGAIMLLEYNTNEKYELIDTSVQSKDILNYATDLIKRTIKRSATQLREKQYEKNELYKANREFYKELLNINIDKEDLKDKLYQILFKIKKSIDFPEVYDVVEAFVSIFLTILKDINSFRKIRPEIINIYESIWSLIALLNARESLIECGYTKEFLDMYLDFDTSLELADQSLFELKDLIKMPLVVQI